jgi:hypothetical protein
VENPYQPPQASPSDPAGLPGLPGSIRPATATVFGILNLVYGGFGLICNPINGALNLLIPNPQGRVNNPILEIAIQPIYRHAIAIYAGVSTVACALLVIAGIGLLTMKPWGRTLSVRYVILDIAAAVCYLGFNGIYLFAPMIDLARRLNSPQATGNAIGAVIGGVGVFLLGLIYPVLLLIFMTRPGMVQAFTGRGADGPATLPAA